MGEEKDVYIYIYIKLYLYYLYNIIAVYGDVNVHILYVPIV